MPVLIPCTQSSGLSIGYMAVGEGLVEMLIVPGWFSRLALDREEATLVRCCERIAPCARLVRDHHPTS
jgi:hypothetical protein